MYTYEQLVELYKALGESDKMAKRHAYQAMELQKPEALLESYVQGSKIKQRATARKYNNLH